MFTKAKFFDIILTMDTMGSKNQNPKRSLFDQPRKAVSGLVYSGAILGMLLFSLAFSITVALLSGGIGMTVDEISQTQAYKYISYILYQIVYIGVIACFMAMYRESPAQFGWRKTHWRFYLIAVVLLFGLLFGLNYVNGWFVQLLGLLGYEAPSSTLPSLAGGGLFGVLLVVAVIPAVCEETIFRGIMLEGIKDIGTVAACLLGGLLFSIFHQNPAQTVYQFICGAVFTLLALRADSLLPTVLIHFLNNALIILNERFGFLNFTAGAQIAVYVVSGICLAASLAWLIFVERKQDAGKREAVEGEKSGEIRPFLYPAIAGIVVCVLFWILNFINGTVG